MPVRLTIIVPNSFFNRTLQLSPAQSISDNAKKIRKHSIKMKQQTENYTELFQLTPCRLFLIS
ncbi:MAG: hypothetical protein DWQ09_00750 [Proteobacteria bacterium]|nr:MAG: hypothetical protein DWQ09_00750 [Pseudomonadota bacterium]